jgi:hypothetical protein
MKSPNVLGGETRGDGSGHCQGTPPKIFRCTIFDTIDLDKLISAKHESLPEAKALSAMRS